MSFRVTWISLSDRLIWSLWSLVLGCLPVFTVEAKESSNTGHLRLASGDFAKGVLVGSSKANHIDWQCEAFDRPLSIDINQLQRLETGVVHSAQANDGVFLFNVNGTDSFSGTIVRASDEDLVIRNEILGEVVLPMSMLSQIRRVESPRDLLFQGLATDPSIRGQAEQESWQFNGQTLVASKSSGNLVCNLNLAPKSRIDIRMSWEGQPQFEIALGVDDQPSTIATAPHIEVWDRALVLVQQVNGQADATFLRELADNESDISLTIYQDQASGLVAVFTTSGALLGKIQLTDKSTASHSKLSFFNQGTRWSLDSIAVSKWNGVLPYPHGDTPQSTQPSRHDVTGRLTNFDENTQLLTIVGKEGTEESFPLDGLATLVSIDSSTQKATQTGDAGLPRVQVILKDGSQIAGELAAAEPGFLKVRNKHARTALVCPVNGVLSVRKLSDAITALPPASKRMKLKMDGVELSGLLTEMSEVQPNARLRFQPSFSDGWVGIRETAQGSIGPSRANTTHPSTPSDPGVGNVRVFLPAQARPPEENESPIVSAYRTPRGLQLRSGDLLDATIESIDESGIHFHSSATSCSFLPHRAIQSAQIRIPLRGVPIDVKKMERLLTVPRMRRDNPPTHLVITTAGDYLRGRVINMDQEIVEFEEGVSSIKIPRNAVAVVIWLHDRLWEDQIASEELEDDADVFQVHARLRSTGRFTFQPERIDQEMIYGTSRLIGPVTCALSNIESLEFGKNITGRIAEREENAWRLQLAKSPNVFAENDPNGLPMGEQLGTGSELVGKQAPNFELKSIIGQPWRLSHQIGKLLVLDFWASWCGPCMDAMPQVERIVTDLNRDDCLWVGINIQETAERAQSAIDRLRIQSLVLLDEDGGVGSEYDARAIPLTVIVDREGVVRHVFVGGGQETLAGIEKAIHSLAEKPIDSTQ